MKKFDITFTWNGNDWAGSILAKDEVSTPFCCQAGPIVPGP